MASPSECPSPFILRSIATGGIQEPLLGLYLAHLEHCDRCCAAIDREAGVWTGAVVGGRVDAAAESWKSSGMAERNDWVGDWVETLKRATPISAADDASPVGLQLGPFRVTSVLGQGASAIVYEAIDANLDRRVVLKVLRSIHGGDSARKQMVMVEARALAAVQHEAIMPLLQLFWFEESPVLVFPRLPGETLGDALAAGRMTCRTGLEVVRDVARGLGHSHSLGIFHYDVKPNNIWLHRLPDGRSKPLLFDFGLSGGTGDSVGTPGYSDPTAPASRHPEARDLFSLGVVLYECLAECDDVPAGARDLVHRLTVAPAAARPHAAAVADEIQRMLRPSTRARWVAAAVAGLAAVVLAAAGVVPRMFDRSVAVDQGAESRVLAPESILPARGLPVAISTDAVLQAFVEDGGTLQIITRAPEKIRASVPLPFRPDRLAFNADARRLALAAASGDVAIVDVATGQIEVTHRFGGGVSSMAWTGWERDALVVLSGDAVSGFFEASVPAAGPQPRPWPLVPLRDGVVRFASLPNSEAIVSLDEKGAITIWSVGNLTPDTHAMLPPVSDPRSADVRIGWKGPGVCYTASGTRVLAYASHHTIITESVVAPIESIVWMNDAQYVVLSRQGDGSSRVVVGDTERPGWTRTCDIGGEPIERIELLKDHRRVAAVTGAGAVRVYHLRP